MKKILLLLALTIVLVTCLVACDRQTEHTTHSFGEWSVTKNATCTEDGVKTRYCSCSEKQSDAIPATGHNKQTLPAIESTCTETGLTEGNACSTCGAIFTEQTVIPAKGHSFGDWVVVKKATEIEEGLKERYCNCGEKESETIAKIVASSQGLEFALNKDGVSYSVTGIGTCTDADVVIPGTYNGLPVTSIGSSAFRYCFSLTSVVIPDSVASIGGYAFYGCSSLKSLKVDSNNANYKDINGNLYTKDGKTLIQYAIGKSDIHFVIPNSVTSISNYAFYSCDLTGVVIPSSVTSIGSEAFYCCSSLESVVIPDSVISIGDDAFGYCSNLTSIVIPDSVTSIGDDAFMFCSSLESVVIGDSVTSIGGFAFYCCSSLESVVIPNSVTSIGDYAFWRCSSLESIVIPDSVTSIGVYAFGYCSSLTNVVIPNSVTSIGEMAFWRCSSLKSLKVDSNNANYKDINGNLYTKDGKTLIQYAIGKSDTHFVIPNSVTNIDNSAFYGCTSLTSVVIPDSVTSIGWFAFSGCTGLESVVIPDSVTSIEDSAFNNCTGLTSIEIPDSVISIGNCAFEGCSSLTSVVIPDSVTSIDKYAFYNCYNLTSIKYRGTESQWNAISKDSDWDSETGDYTIIYNYVPED